MRKSGENMIKQIAATTKSKIRLVLRSTSFMPSSMKRRSPFSSFSLTMDIAIVCSILMICFIILTYHKGTYCIITIKNYLIMFLQEFSSCIIANTMII